MNEEVRAREATWKHAKELLKIPGVQLVYTRTKIKAGIDTKQPATIVCVEKKLSPSELSALKMPMIPPELNGTVTDVIEVGKLTAPPPKSDIKIRSASDHQKKFRPKVPGGVTAIEYCSSACTLTTWVWSDKLGEPVALQNWHCCRMQQCRDGWILQPSPYDLGFYPADVIGQFIAGDINNPYTDSGISCEAEPHGFATMEIYGLGSFKGYCIPEVDDRFIKSGRTTGVTQGTVLALDGAANISYPDEVRQKEDLIVTTHMLDGGDSSSPAKIIRNGVIQPPLAGQGFAGSDTVSCFIKIPNIISDPALAPYKLNFDYEYEAPTPAPEPPQPEASCPEEFTECLAAVESVWDLGGCILDFIKCWFKIKKKPRYNKSRTIGSLDYKGYTISVQIKKKRRKR
jgi:endonuclease G